MTKYIVYCHTLNNKKYIGYTKKTMFERLLEHIEDSQNSSDRHFHRAIRKYGAENIVSEQLCEVETTAQAKLKECFYVEQFDTFKNGYNMTQGGDGGNTTEKYSTNRMKKLSKLRSSLQVGMKNSNAKPSITKDMIVDAVVQFCIDNTKQGNYLLRKEIESVLKQQLGVSQMTLKNRIDRGLKQLIDEVNNKLLVPIKYNPYYRGEEQRKQASSATSKQRWATNGVDNVKITADTLEKFLVENTTYRQGRTLKNREDRCDRTK